MPIPDFDHNNVIPPHNGNPTNRSDLSPYRCTIMELCNKLATSDERIEILKGLIGFRKKLNENGIVFGFQWLDGSFMENIEALEHRSPRDLDIVTFYGSLNEEQLSNIVKAFPEFVSHILSKKTYKLDHYSVDYSFSPKVTIEATKYWIQLFSHNRNGVWKGMIDLPLNTPIDDDQALQYLNHKIL